VQRLGRLGIEGDIVECGVYKGGSAAVLGSAMVRLDDERPRKLWLFDSFAGMPPAGEQDGAFSHTLKVTYVGSEQQTRALLGQAGVPPGRFEIVKGLYADTFPTVEIPLLHIDCDFYEPHKLTLEKFYPAVSPGGFVVLNDYGIYKGARAATDEFFEVTVLTSSRLRSIRPRRSFRSRARATQDYPWPATTRATRAPWPEGAGPLALLARRSEAHDTGSVLFHGAAVSQQQVHVA